jgi:uncharacterized protein YPO0396
MLKAMNADEILDGSERVEEEQFELDLAVSKDASFLLTHLEVFNWGPFRGMHRAEFDPQGTAIIGPTGSGKTTLVDALMTLLVAQPRYNLASTGGHESDRTLIQYVRGVLGGDGADGREAVARPGKTISAICATYRGGSQTVRLAGLFWTEGTSNSTDDLKRRWIFSLAEEQTLEGWLRSLHDEGIRDLMKMGRETAALRIFESKKAFLTHARKFFDVGENAFTLLNRAAGLKQLNSIDEIFRELVLDDHSAYDRALEVAAEFDNLSAIHEELETAKRQVDALLPIEREHNHLVQTQAKLAETKILKQIIPIYFAILAEEKWKLRLHELNQQKSTLHSEAQKVGEEKSQCQAQVDALRERYLELGGNVISELEKSIGYCRERVADRQKHSNIYLALVKQLGLRDDLTREGLDANQAELRRKNDELQKVRTKRYDETLAAKSEQRDLENQVAELESTIRKVKERPGSNIPLKFQDFRFELATELAIDSKDLPFLAELVEVQPDHADWRGAVERAIGSERLRILVPDSRIDAALDWVNRRDNRLHVRLQQARRDDRPEPFFSDSYLHKLNFKKHPLIETAKKLLSSRDLHCVKSANALKSIEHGLTREGMISGKQGRFEKQDQRRLDEDLMTGFDNKDQMELLAKQLLSIHEKLDRSNRNAEQTQRVLVELDQQLKLIEQLIELDFQTIDLVSAEKELAHSEERLRALLNPSSDAGQAKKEYDLERQKLESIDLRLREIEKKIAVVEKDCSHAEAQGIRAKARAMTGLTEDQQLIASKNLSVVPGALPEDLIDQERDLYAIIDKKLATQTNQVADIEQSLVRYMGIAKRVDTGALVDTDSRIEDIAVYLERLRVLRDEALPEKKVRFLEYLNRSSDQGVTQLLSSIKEEVDAIEQRINELNLTLLKVDFRSSRYLQLQPQKIQDERLRALDTAMRKVRSAALKDDGGESHFKALQEMVAILREAGENRRLQGSRALLDPRFRLNFYVVEVDRTTGHRSPPRIGSQSGSGGEKELMASHILTASLSYALCPAEATRPLYATVVLDEAFSKSSPSAASRIIEALRIFHLHPIFVTPNKEIGLLKRHTRKVICVQRPAKEASLASISWETLEKIAKPTT